MSKNNKELLESDEPFTVGLKVKAIIKNLSLRPRFGKIKAINDYYYLIDVVEPYKGKNRKFNKSDYNFYRV